MVTDKQNTTYSSGTQLPKIEMTSGLIFHNLLPMVENPPNQNESVRHPEFARRLHKAMADANISVSDIKKALGVTYEMARRYSLGIAMPRQEKIEQLANLVKSTPAFLAYGTEGPLFSKKASDDGVGAPRPVIAVSDDDEIPGVARIRRVKLQLSAGIAGFAVDPVDGDAASILLPQWWLDQRGYKRELLLATDVKGRSMEPTLYEGDTVVINTADTKLTDGDVFAINYEGEGVVKRASKDMGSWWLTSDNPDQRRYPKKQCANDGCIVVGRIVWRQSEHI